MPIDTSLLAITVPVQVPANAAPGSPVTSTALLVSPDALQPQTAPDTITVAPGLTLDHASGPSDSMVSATYHLEGARDCSFLQQSDTIQFTWDGEAWGTGSPPIDSNPVPCNWSVSPKLPPTDKDSPGLHQIVAEDIGCADSCDTASRTPGRANLINYAVTQDFTILEPTLQLSPSSGNANTDVTATLNFPGATVCPADGVSLTWSGNGASPTSWGTTATTGLTSAGCSATIDPVPPSGSSPGTYTVTGTDAGCACSATTSFTIPSPATTTINTSPSTSGGTSTPPVTNPAPAPAPAPAPTSAVLGTTAPTPPPSPTPPAAPSGSPPSGGGGPSGVSPLWGATLTLPASAFTASVQTAVVLAAVLLLLVLIPFPAELFNATYDENQARIKRWWGAHLPWLVAAYEFFKDEEGRRGRAVALVIVVIIGGVLGAALDPAFGWNLHTVSLSGSVALALILCAATTAISVILFRRRHLENTRFRVRALPGGLAITLIGVVVSRLLNFEPGYLYGLILVASFFELESPKEEGKEVALSSIALIGFSVAAWALWIPVQGAAAQAGASGGLVFLADLLTAIFVIGIVRAVILLVPMHFLPGLKLFRWSKLAWAAIFGVGAFAMAEIMLLPQSGQYLRSVAPVATTLGLFFGFGLASLLFWAYFRYHKPEFGETTDDALG
ncbi:MAG: hypothetical protein JOY80_07125 [Candidatus Dormibacteraeota bacterium]|nr:hypothetical protein [Candidatus Dormibacteraeota bacterium]